MNRRGIASALLALLLLVFCSAASAQSVEQAVLTDWENYLTLMEYAYAGADWAYGYAQAYIEDNSWDNLLRARAAAGTAQSRLSHTKAPQSSVSIEQYADMTARGMDVEVVGLMMDAAQDSVNIVARDMMLLHNHMNVTAYDEQGIRYVEKLLDINRRDIALQAQSLCVDTNYILVQLGDAVDAEGWWAQLGESYPFLAAHAPAYTTDTEALERHADGINNQFDALLGDVYESSAIYSFYIESYIDALDGGDYAAIRERLVPIAGVGEPELMPYWLQEEEITASYICGVQDDGTVLLCEMGDDLSALPTGCLMTCEGVSREDFLSYAQSLGALRMLYADEGADYETDEELSFLVVLDMETDEGNYLISWKSGKAQLYFANGVRFMLPAEYFL